MKRFFSTVLAASLFLSVVPGASADFSDLSSTNEHYAAVNALVEQGVLEGYSDGTFKPDQSVNRAEALKIILKGLGVTVNNSEAALLFTDVALDDWFADYVGTAVNAGIVQGYSDGSFKPEQTVNRAEAMKMLTLAAGVTVPSASASFEDVSMSDWYAAYASYAKQWNIVSPQTDGLWHAGDELTRGDISEMVYRLQEVQASKGSFDEATNWLRTSFNTVNVSMKIPFGWGVKQDGVGAAFLLDSEAGQTSLLNPYDNGGSLLMTRYRNSEGQSTDDLFSTVRAHASGTVTESTVNGYDALVIEENDGTRYKEWYIVLPNGAMVNFVALRGEGAYSKYLEWYFNAMIGSVEYMATTSTDLTVDETVEQLRAAIQVDGVGQEMMDLLNDWELFETDSIGVGTGPVDYYYSPSANLTVKYERSYDVILDVRDGESSAF